MNNVVDTPKIAIIIPVYNVEKYLEECLRSVSNQTFQNWECYIVNDGSKDNSGAIADRFSNQDSRFKVIHKSNGGVCAARNLALELIEKAGCFDYVGFVDGDDRIDENMYSLLADSIQMNNSDIAVCGYYKFYDDNREVIKKGINGDGIISIDDYVSLVMSRGRWRNNRLAGGMIVKNLFSLQVIKGLRFTKEDIVEDELLSIQVVKNASKISIVDQALYGYRQREDSAVRDSKFLHRLIGCRRLCIDEAKTISENARLVTLVAYLSVVMNLFKQEENPKSLLTNYEADFIEAKKAGLIDFKVWFLYNLFTKGEGLAKVYRTSRRVIKIFRSKL